MKICNIRTHSIRGKILLIVLFISIFLFSSVSKSVAQTNVLSYQTLIDQADKALAAKDLPTAIFLYQKASQAKPDNKYASGKIAEINALLDADAESRAIAFESIILKAESLFKQKNYAQAQTEYQKALALDPTAQFPKDRLSQISAVYTDPSDLQYFNDAISNGDRALESGEFDKAVMYYETALAVKPGTKAVRDKISATRKQQADEALKIQQAEKILVTADALYKAQKRSEARAEYQKVLDLTPKNEHALQMAAEIDNYTNKKKLEQEQYEKAIEQADQFYINRDFANARLKYAEALVSKPDARYPKEMLEKTKSGESQLLSDQQKFDAAIAGAEKFYSNADYEAALIGFRSAQAIKPAETYPKTKIAEIEKLISERTSRREAFDIAIKNGDQALGDTKYEQALVHYRNALSLLPGEKYPTQRIEEITAELALQKAKDDNYRRLIADGDKLFGVAKYADAIPVYTQAQELKPAETYPAKKIAEAQTELDKLRSKDENYTAAIAEADKLFANGQPADALLKYKQALLIKPAEKYPKEKADEITKLLASQKQDNDAYTLAISNADKALAAGNLNLALTTFRNASAIKPNENYPKEKISSINAELEAQAKTNELYNTALKTADNLFTSKEYARSLAAYTEASELKKTEKYPLDQIEKINKILDSERSANENYNLAITEADAFLNENKLNESLASYKKASLLKSAEDYPKVQIAKVNELIALQKKLESDYQNTILAADKLFAAKNYSEAINLYRTASQLKPAEKYPIEKITACESSLDAASRLLAEQAAKKELFDKTILTADNLFAANELTNALEEFKKASQLIETEKYPKQRITEIQAILDKNKATDQKYTEAIAAADQLLEAKNYPAASEKYKTALSLKSAEKYPQDQITKINQLIEDQKTLEQNYALAISDGNTLLKEKKYNESKVRFSDALVLKPSEKLPSEKIAEIETIVNGIEKTEADYARFIKEADAFFAAEKLNEALTSYTSAEKLKPAETYPKTQISKINTLLAEQKKANEEYQKIIAAADDLFNTLKYKEAISEYRKALAIKPAETYPLSKIAETEKLISEQLALRESYEKAIAVGDEKFANKQYSEALLAYTNASGLQPAETYPAQKIAEIKTITDKIEAENKAYQDAITLADNFYNSKKLREALEPYQRATTIKPAEKYPQDQILLINQQLSELKKLDEAYQQLLTDAAIELNAEKYTSARELYTRALTMKAEEKLPREKIAEIDAKLAALQLRDENYQKALDAAGNFYTAKKLQDAINSYQVALTLKPAEKFPSERIAAINSEIKEINDRYNSAIALGDKELAANNLMEALNAYQNAAETKPAETYPKTKIDEINAALVARKEEMEKMFTSYVQEGDNLLAAKDYVAARSAYSKAGSIKPDQEYPKQKIAEINKITEELELAMKAEYAKALGEADKLYNTKIFDQAIDAYEAASRVNTADSYPGQQIAKIRKYLTDHAIQDLYSQALLISEGTEKKFTFSSIEPRLRKNNYILLKARSAGKGSPKVYLNYGKDNQKNGGIVLRSLDKTEISDYLIRISVQDKWYREDNNWVSLYVETGDIEITKVQIAAGDE